MACSRALGCNWSSHYSSIKYLLHTHTHTVHIPTSLLALPLYSVRWPFYDSEYLWCSLYQCVFASDLSHSVIKHPQPHHTRSLFAFSKDALLNRSRTAIQYASPWGPVSWSVCWSRKLGNFVTEGYQCATICDLDFFSFFWKSSVEVLHEMKIVYFVSAHCWSYCVWFIVHIFQIFPHICLCKNIIFAYTLPFKS